MTGTELHGTSRGPTEVLASERAGPTMKDATARLGVSIGTVAIANAMRRRPFGAVTSKLADLAGITERHARRCLQVLESKGICERTRTSVHDGHSLRTRTVWKLSSSQESLKVVEDLPRLNVRLPTFENGRPTKVPRRFWHLFWSGTRGEDIRIDKHASYVAETLIGSRDVSAEAWALLNLPDDALLGTWRSARQGPESLRLVENELRTRGVLPC